MPQELKKKTFVDPGSLGLPNWYPHPPMDEDLLFYIQRNQNQDTIVYSVNRTTGGLINSRLPMEAYWIKFTQGGIRRELNDLQNKLAFGYDADMISRDLFKFQFVAYPTMDLFIVRTKEERYEAHYRMNDRMVRLKHIYVYAVEFGVFPDVKYIEFYGEELNTGLDAYSKITIE